MIYVVFCFHKYKHLLNVYQLRQTAIKQFVVFSKDLAIWWQKIELEQNELSLNFEWQWKSCQWNWPSSGSDRYASIENAVYHPIYLKSTHLIKGTCYFPFSLTCYFSWKMPRERQCVLLRFKAQIILSILSVTKCAYVDPLHWFIEAQIYTAAYQQRPTYIIFNVYHAPNTQN